MYNKKSNFIPKYLTNFVSICRCNLYSIGLPSPMLVLTGDYMMRSHLEETKKQKQKKLIYRGQSLSMHGTIKVPTLSKAISAKQRSSLPCRPEGNAYSQVLNVILLLILN